MWIFVPILHHLLMRQHQEKSLFKNPIKIFWKKRFDVVYLENDFERKRIFRFKETKLFSLETEEDGQRFLRKLTE